ncbi:MAG: hypothetical protein KGZ94_02065 [Clostridia bacterium]|nr:hypothetical protein [Clostridia bacterium]
MSIDGFSLNILSELLERYGDWVDPDLKRLRIVQKANTTFLEATYDTNSNNRKGIVRESLNFIMEDIGKRLHLFPTTSTPQENAERFFDKLDLYSIVMTGIGDMLFSEDGVNAALEYIGAVKGECNEDITRRLE